MESDTGGDKPETRNGCYQDIGQLKALDGWKNTVREYLRGLRARLEALNAAPNTEEERREKFQVKRHLVPALADHVLVGKNRHFGIVFRLDVLEFVQGISEVWTVGTYADIPDSSLLCILVAL